MTSLSVADDPFAVRVPHARALQELWVRAVPAEEGEARLTVVRVDRDRLAGRELQGSGRELGDVEQPNACALGLRLRPPLHELRALAPVHDPAVGVEQQDRIVAHVLRGRLERLPGDPELVGRRPAAPNVVYGALGCRATRDCRTALGDFAGLIVVGGVGARGFEPLEHW